MLFLGIIPVLGLEGRGGEPGLPFGKSRPSVEHVQLSSVLLIANVNLSRQLPEALH